jgi:hypothetical protein
VEEITGLGYSQCKVMIRVKRLDASEPIVEHRLMTVKYRTVDDLKFESWEWV